MEFYAIVLAAGRGIRMRDGSAPSELPKVLRRIAGRPMIAYVVDALTAAGITDISLVVGFGADLVREAMGDRWRYIVQDQQLGSGHAVASAKDVLGGRGGHVIVMCGDSPLFTSATIVALKQHHRATGAAVTLVSAQLDDPAGYGRIIGGRSGEIVGVVEEKCASECQKAIREINGGAYAFDSQWLWRNIERIDPNDTGERNLTDMVRVAVLEHRKVEAVPAPPEEVMGANTLEDLRRLEEVLRERERK